MSFEHIKEAIEHNEKIREKLSLRASHLTWDSFTRSHFNTVARVINRKVTDRVIEDPTLVFESLILGKDSYLTLSEKHEINSTKDFTDFLTSNKSRLPFSWISGKTIQSYWNSGIPKEIKLNVILVYLNIPQNEWEIWKYGTPRKSETKSYEENVGLPSKYNILSDSLIFKNLNKYYTGSYYLYYLRTDSNNIIVKAPFVIKNEDGCIIAETCTENHRYKSFPAKRIQKNIYFLCRNLDWEEFESHLINIGLESNPEVLFGVSITMTVKEGMPVGIKNVFIKQSSDIHFLDKIKETSLRLDEESQDEEEKLMIKYFQSNPGSIHFASSSVSVEDLKNQLYHKK